MDAERRAAANKAAPPTLEDIYRELGHGLALDEGDLAPLREAELELERQLMRPMPAGRALVEQERAAGNRLVFLSDMYLPADRVAQYLSEHSVRRDDDALYVAADALYVSADHGQTKASGGLFKMMLEAEGILARDVLHTGNDPAGDVRSARRLGLAIRPLLDANLNRYEQILDNHATTTDGLTAALGGAARLARLCVPAGDQNVALRDMAASVAGPTLASYVLWVLNRAQRREIEYLFFASRDGQVLLEIARRLAPKVGYTGRLVYLHCSRRAINFAAFGANIPAQARWLWMPQSSPTCDALLAQVGVRPEEMEPDLVRLGLPPDMWLRPLERGERQRLLTFLEGPFVERLAERHLDRRSLVLEYLGEAGFLEAAQVGIVDLGGAGSQYRALRMLREQTGRSAPAGFVVHLDRPPAVDADSARSLSGEDLHAWLNDTRRELGFPRFRGLAAALLVFCQADHGTVLAYHRRGGRVEPVLAPSNPSSSSHEFWLVRETILRVAEEVILDDELLDRQADARQAIWEILNLLWKQPSRAEAMSWKWLQLQESPHPEIDDGNDLASPYGLSELVHLLRHRTWPGPWYTWPKASIEMSPQLTRIVLKTMLWGRRRVKRRSKHTPGGG